MKKYDDSKTVCLKNSEDFYKKHANAAVSDLRNIQINLNKLRNLNCYLKGTEIQNCFNDVRSKDYTCLIFIVKFLVISFCFQVRTKFLDIKTQVSQANENLKQLMEQYILPLVDTQIKDCYNIYKKQIKTFYNEQDNEIPKYRKWKW